MDETSDSRHAAGTPARMKLYPHHQHHGPTFLATCFISVVFGVVDFLFLNSNKSSAGSSSTYLSEDW